MKISHKLVGSFIGASLLTGVVGAVAVTKSLTITQTIAMAEAEHVAQVLAASISHNFYSQQTVSIDQAPNLQNYANQLHELQKRDIVVVNKQKLILADAVRDNSTH